MLSRFFNPQLCFQTVPTIRSANDMLPYGKPYRSLPALIARSRYQLVQQVFHDDGQRPNDLELRNQFFAIAAAHGYGLEALAHRYQGPLNKKKIAKKMTEAFDAYSQPAEFLTKLYEQIKQEFKKQGGQIERGDFFQWISKDLGLNVKESELFIKMKGLELGLNEEVIKLALFKKMLVEGYFLFSADERACLNFVLNNEDLEPAPLDGAIDVLALYSFKLIKNAKALCRLCLYATSPQIQYQLIQNYLSERPDKTRLFAISEICLFFKNHKQFNREVKPKLLEQYHAECFALFVSDAHSETLLMRATHQETYRFNEALSILECLDNKEQYYLLVKTNDAGSNLLMLVLQYYHNYLYQIFDESALRRLLNVLGNLSLEQQQEILMAVTLLDENILMLTLQHAPALLHLVLLALGKAGLTNEQIMSLLTARNRKGMTLFTILYQNLPQLPEESMALLLMIMASLPIAERLLLIKLSHGKDKIDLITLAVRYCPSAVTAFLQAFADDQLALDNVLEWNSASSEALLLAARRNHQQEFSCRLFAMRQQDVAAAVQIPILKEICSEGKGQIAKEAELALRLAELAEKMKEYKALEGAELNEKSPYQKAKRLHTQLSLQFDLYLTSKKKKADVETLQREWRAALDHAKPTLAEHRGMKDLWMKLLLCLTVIGGLYLLLRTPPKNEKTVNRMAFFAPLTQTEGMVHLNRLDHAVQELNLAMSV